MHTPLLMMMEKFLILQLFESIWCQPCWGTVDQKMSSSDRRPHGSVSNSVGVRCLQSYRPVSNKCNVVNAMFTIVGSLFLLFKFNFMMKCFQPASWMQFRKCIGDRQCGGILSVQLCSLWPTQTKSIYNPIGCQCSEAKTSHNLHKVHPSSTFFGRSGRSYFATGSFCHFGCSFP